MEAKSKTCQNCKKDFTIEPDDFLFYEKMQVPAPTFCPECRMQRKLLFRNNRVLYKRKCDLCERAMISSHSEDKPFSIYCHECWHSDKWDPLSYGIDYDFSVSFFEQWKKLRQKVPRIHLYQTNYVNSEYCNYGLNMKDCYLVFGGLDNERVYFANQIIDTKDSFDVDFSEKLEFCYETFECSRSNKLYFSFYSSDCVDSRYLLDCKNCIDCFGCVGLINKQYHIFNKPYPKEEYRKFIENSDLGSFEFHKKTLKELVLLSLDIPYRYARVYKSIASTGDDIWEMKNAKVCFSSRQAEDSKYLFFLRGKKKDSYDSLFVASNAELLYEMTSGFGGSNTAFGIRNLFVQDSRYSEDCDNCSNIFGCEGLKKKSYCILNKQYTKEEYEALVPKIIQHMKDMPYIDSKGRVYKYGEFFPSELSPFAYNESIVGEYFPLSKEEALSQGFAWKDVENRNYKVDIDAKDLPDNIKDVGEDIVSKVIGCGHAGSCKHQCTEAFKILVEEFKFYKRMNLPLPRFCPNCRHYERLAQRNPLHLWHRKCMNKLNKDTNQPCENEFETPYSPERPAIVYCEKCYQREVY